MAVRLPHIAQPMADTQVAQDDHGQWHGNQSSGNRLQDREGYYTFDLSDGAEAVRILSTGKARCKAGRATVDGTFDGVRRQIVSTRVRCR